MPEKLEKCCSGPLAVFGGIYLAYKRSFAGKSLWQKAIDECDLVLVQTLADYGRDIDARFAPTFEPDSMYTPFAYALETYRWCAFKDSHVQMLTFLLEAGADPDICKTKNGVPYMTPLAAFVSLGVPSGSETKWSKDQWLNVVRLVLEMGADPNAEYDAASDPNYFIHKSTGPPIRTMLTDYATTSSVTGLATLLIKKGADPNKIVCGKTPLDYAFHDWQGKFNPLDSQRITVASELICAGASAVTIRKSVGGPTLDNVTEDLIRKLFAARAKQVDKKFSPKDLCKQMQSIFDIYDDVAKRIVIKLLTKPKYQSRKMKHR